MGVKRSVLQTVDGAPFEGKASSEDETVASSFGLIAIFLIHSPGRIRNYLKRRPLKGLRDFLNDLDLGVLSQEQTYGALTHVAVSPTPVAKATANRRLEMPLPSFVASSQHVETKFVQPVILLSFLPHSRREQQWNYIV